MDYFNNPRHASLMRLTLRDFHSAASLKHDVSVEGVSGAVLSNGPSFFV